MNNEQKNVPNEEGPQMRSSRSRISLLAQLFASNAYYKEIALEPYSLKLQEKSQTSSQEMLATECILEEGFVWSTLHVKHSDGTWKKIGGLKKLDARRMKEGVELQIQNTKAIVEDLKSEVGSFAKIVDWIEKCKSGSQWVAKRHLQALQSLLDKHAEFWGLPVWLYELSGYAGTYVLVNSVALDWQKFRQSSNEVFRKLEIVRQASFFASLPVPPTLQQSEASICDEDSVLVVASAGSGKTTLLLGKVQYLLWKGMAKPEEILILAFNRSAKEEVFRRLKERTGEVFSVHTFHSFGVEVLANATGKKPRLAPFAESDMLLRNHIQSLLNEVLKDPVNLEITVRFFSEFLRPHQSAFDFKSQGEYFEFVKRQKLVTYRGELVKSQEELTIANWLHLVGVDYCYERAYPYETVTSKHRQYVPDFYLTKYGIYLEHFALDENGNAPSHFKDYKEGVVWKRSVHAAHETKLLESYSYQAKKGVLIEELRKSLISCGVEFDPIRQDAILEILNEKNRVTELAELVATFLHLFKGCGESLESIRARIDRSEHAGKRAFAFVEIFEAVYRLYENSLRLSDTVDFDDMINLSTNEIANQKYGRKFKYLLVDEFQDISLGRAKFLKAIKSNLDVEQLFAVGDDWQAINRFAGGDVTVMTKFESVFGFVSSFKLTKTHRFNNKVNDVATQFILKNPEQLKKEVEPSKFVDAEQVFLVRENGANGQSLLDVLKEINNEAAATTGVDVLILARYNKALDECRAQIPCLTKIKFTKSAEEHTEKVLASYKSNIPELANLSLKFSTVHSSKGQQSDYVVVIGLVAGAAGMRGSGFPSESVDDPIFSYVLAESDVFPNAEERRLFYVALTRTMNKVYLIVDEKNPSKFAKEILSDSYRLERRGFDNKRERKCPACVTSKLVLRTGPKSQFVGCINYPLCSFTAQICSVCHRGVMMKLGLQFVCDNSNCLNKIPACPKCKEGSVVTRNGRNGKFLGCSNYPTTGCDYTENKPSLEGDVVIG